MGNEHFDKAKEQLKENGIPFNQVVNQDGKILRLEVYEQGILLHKKREEVSVNLPYYTVIPMSNYETIWIV